MTTATGSLAPFLNAVQASHIIVIRRARWDGADVARIKQFYGETPSKAGLDHRIHVNAKARITAPCEDIRIYVARESNVLESACESHLVGVVTSPIWPTSWRTADFLNELV
jgi:hypothetical protein